MPSNYDNAAFFYDRLSRLVFGNSLIKSQVYLLQFIRPDSTILIAGGGSGIILEEIAKIYPKGLNITYVELSAKMMNLSMSRWCGSNTLTFITEAVENIATSKGFDVVLTPFLFDNFTTETAKTVFESVHQKLSVGGIWLLADFNLTGKLWQAVLLKMMYIFFRIICRIEATKMPEYEILFKNSGYELQASQSFYGQFIIARQYRKAS